MPLDRLENHFDEARRLAVRNPPVTFIDDPRDVVFCHAGHSSGRSKYPDANDTYTTNAEAVYENFTEGVKNGKACRFLILRANCPPPATHFQANRGALEAESLPNPVLQDAQVREVEVPDGVDLEREGGRSRPDLAREQDLDGLVALGGSGHVQNARERETPRVLSPAP